MSNSRALCWLSFLAAAALAACANGPDVELEGDAAGTPDAGEAWAPPDAEVARVPDADPPPEEPEPEPEQDPEAAEDEPPAPDPEEPGGDEGLCSNDCRFAHDGQCHDGGPGSASDVCALGTDCGDCGPREPEAPDPNGGADDPQPDDPQPDDPQPDDPDPDQGGDPRRPPDPCDADPCNGRGWCMNGSCICDPGYAGAGCNVCDGVWQEVPDRAPLLCLPVRQVDGTDGDDPVLDGSGDADYLRGLGGNDTIRGLEGQDYINGNVGSDFVNGNGGRDEVRGGSEDDEVHGGAQDDVVYGDLGNDQVYGDLGDDRLIGGPGDDILWGGGGNDRYMLDGLGNDIINDESGFDSARCTPGVRAVVDQVVGRDRHIQLSTGGRVTILGDSVEEILGCD